MNINSYNLSTQNNNTSPYFKGGITRKLSRNFYSCENDIIDVFNKHPQKDGIAGQLPTTWIEKLNSCTNKRGIIKEVLKKFGLAVKQANENLTNASNSINEIFHKYNILKDNQNYHLVKVDTSHAAYTQNGYILMGKNGAESFFIKEFKDLSCSSPALYKLRTDGNGKYTELARGLMINNQINDRHIMKVHWGDTKKGYMVSEYVKPLKEYESPIVLKDVYDNEAELIIDLNKKYGFTSNEIKKYNVKLGTEYEGKFYPYPEEERIINSYFSSLLEKHGLKCDESIYNTDNYIITADKNGNPLIKLIDFGEIYTIKK